MRILLLVFLFSSAALFAEAQQINGLVKDDSGTPLAGATVQLVKATDSSTIKLAVAKADGSYNFSGIKPGDYKVMVTYVGYNSSYSAGFLLVHRMLRCLN